MPQDLYKLPQGWEWVILKDVVQKTDNQNPASDPDRKWTYIDISSVDRNTNRITDPKMIEGKNAPSRARKHVLANDVLFATTRPNLKNIAIFEGGLESPIASTGFCVLRSSELLDQKYLFYFLITENLQNQIAPFISGASYPAITDKNLKSIHIPLPPLPEQQRIAHKLDALFSRIDAATNHLNQILTHSQAMFASALDQILRSGEWASVELGSIAKVQSGTGFPKEYQGFEGEAFPFLKVSDMNLRGNEDCIIRWNNSISKKTATLIKAKIMPAGTVIFPKIGAAIATNKKRILSVPSSYDNNVMGLVPGKDILPKYLFWYMQGVNLGDWASASSLPSMKASTVKEQLIPLPSLHEQTRIVEHLDSLSARIQSLEKATRERIDHLATLKSSLLDVAFRGGGGAVG